MHAHISEFSGQPDALATRCCPPKFSCNQSSAYELISRHTVAVMVSKSKQIININKYHDLQRGSQLE